MTEEEIRNFVFIWLHQRKNKNAGVFTREELSRECIIDNRVITLIGAAGIWFPQNFSIPISITTTTTSPYNDNMTPDGFVNYSYRGDNINHRYNIGLRKALQTKTPLIYFQGIVPGKYFAMFPVYIVEDNPNDIPLRR